jgi:hypothetical protein
MVYSDASEHLVDACGEVRESMERDHHASGSRIVDAPTDGYWPKCAAQDVTRCWDANYQEMNRS